MRKSYFILRLGLISLVVIAFAFAAIHLYQKQQLKINYLSFKLENANHSFVIPDIDRLLNKIESAEALEMEGLHPDISALIDYAANQSHFSFNRELARECFISSSPDQFVLVFNTSSSLNSLITVVFEQLDVGITSVEAGVEINGKPYFTEHFGNYLAFSNVSINPKESEEKLYYGNADYVVFDSDSSNNTRHILSKNYHFKVWENEQEQIKGRSVSHQPYFNVVPADFDHLVFYGSQRIHEDAKEMFKGAQEESFAWLSDGLILIKKGEFELLMAQQGTQRDLVLMLEEQTFKHQNDSAKINYFNIGNFKIMHFKSDFQWQESIPELSKELSLYTEYNNFNVMANSIPAMRWFLGQVQLGNLIQNNQVVGSTYTDCLPENAHYVEMRKNESGGYYCYSKIFNFDGGCLHSAVTSGEHQLQMEGIKIVYDFPVEIEPSRLTAINTSTDSLLLLNNSSELALYGVNGEKKWKLSLSSPLVEDPQIVDFNNDGNFQVVLFQSNQIDVVNSKGMSIDGFPARLNGTSSAGLAVNYDNLFKYRLIVNVDNTVKVYSEAGKIVEGWMFNGMNAGIASKIYHVITEGKDIIAFKDKGNTQHVLNRRGEYRLDKEINFSLSNETDFVVGSLESALRKMGYKDGYIYNYYILDGQMDSVIIDQKVTPIKTYWEFNDGKPLLILEEPDRLLIVNQFGYVQSEVLKPNQSNQFVGLVGKQDYGFVFADNSQNTIYLLNNFGKMILPKAVEGSKVSIIDGNLLYTFSGISIKAFKIAD